MAILKSLQFTTLQKTAGDPVMIRRARLIARLEEQKALVQDPDHIRTTQRWVKVDGEKQPVQKQQRVRPWWRIEVSGQVVMTVYYGNRQIEFDKGKTGIAVPSKDKLLTVIDTLITAVRQGELDDLLSQAKGQRVVGKPRKVA